MGGQLGQQGWLSLNSSQLCTRVADVGIWHPLLPQHSRGEAAFSALSGQTPFQAWITCTAPADGQVLFYTSFSQKECQNVLGWIYKILYFMIQPNCKSNTQIFDPCYWLTREILNSMDRIVQTVWLMMYAWWCMQTVWLMMCACIRGLRSKGLAARGISIWFLWLWELQIQPVFMNVTSAHHYAISSIYSFIHSCASDSSFVLSNGRLFHKLQMYYSHIAISVCFV